MQCQFTHSVKTYTFQLKCLHAMDENVTYLVLCPESSPTPPHMHMLSVKTVIYVPSMTFFPKQKLLFYKSKSIRKTLIFTYFYQVPCVFVSSKFPGSHRRLCTPSNTFTNFHRWIHMSNKEYQVFHSSGYLSLLAIHNTRIFHFLFLLCNHETHFGRCCILSSPSSNTKHNVDPPCTHDIPSNTKHNVDLHPFNAMSPCIFNARCHCMLYHVTCIMNAT